FPKPNDDKIIRISSIRGEILSKGKEVEGEDLMLNGMGDNQLLSAGSVLYKNYCASCHKDDGKGLPGMSPPLLESPRVLGAKASLIGLVLTGNTGAIGVDQGKYDQVMPAFGFLNDKEIAAVLSFVRNRFGHGAGKVSPGEVANARR